MSFWGSIVRACLRLRRLRRESNTSLPNLITPLHAAYTWPQKRPGANDGQSANTVVTYTDCDQSVKWTCTKNTEEWAEHLPQFLSRCALKTMGSMIFCTAWHDQTHQSAYNGETYGDQIRRWLIYLWAALSSKIYVTRCCEIRPRHETCRRYWGIRDSPATRWCSWNRAFGRGGKSTSSWASHKGTYQWSNRSHKYIPTYAGSPKDLNC